jgi:type IV pilus assembly protein PilA
MNQNRTRKGFSLIALLVVAATLLILAAITIPQLHHNPIPGQETVAIRQVGIVNTAETQYYSQYGKFAVNLAELGPPSSGPAGPNGSDLIPSELALGKKSGFIFTVQGTPLGYSVTAVPEVFGSSGRRCFTPTRPTRYAKTGARCPPLPPASKLDRSSAVLRKSYAPTRP